MVPANALSRITCSKPCEIISQDLITVNNLSMVMNGSSEFTESDIDITCNKLSVFCYGNTNIGQHVFKGNINELYMKLEGRIKVNAMDLTVNKATIINKSAYDSYVNVKQQLTVNTYSTGNTFYIGNPEINHQRVHVPYLNSTGEVISYQ